MVPFRMAASRPAQWFSRQGTSIFRLIFSLLFLNHVGAVFFGRYVAELDNNIFYGIAGFYTSPFNLYFIPYYFLGVVAIFVHVACAVHWLSRNGIAEASV